MGREQNKDETGEGRRGEGNTCPQTPRVCRTPSSHVYAWAHISRVLVTEMTNEKKERHVNRSNALQIQKKKKVFFASPFARSGERKIKISGNSRVSQHRRVLLLHKTATQIFAAAVKNLLEESRVTQFKRTATVKFSLFLAECYRKCCGF